MGEMCYTERQVSKHSGPVAQRSEQGTHNPLVGGSNPPRSTIVKSRLDVPDDFFFFENALFNHF